MFFVVLIIGQNLFRVNENMKELFSDTEYRKWSLSNCIYIFYCNFSCFSFEALIGAVIQGVSALMASVSV